MQQKIFVRKDIPVMNGESLQAYANKINKPVMKWVKQQLNLKNEGAYIRPIEVFSKTIIVTVSQYDRDLRETIDKYYACSYTRKENGDFEFSNLTEVERVSGYQQKKQDISKAKWSTEYINDLPDASFAIILPGGKKDEDGKTVPRTLRMLPHHDMDVKSPTENKTVDLSHLKNALARLSQSDMSDAQKKKAEKHLKNHAKELLPSYENEKTEKSLFCCGWVIKDFWDYTV